jgi:hypothetical protein
MNDKIDTKFQPINEMIEDILSSKFESTEAQMFSDAGLLVQIKL